MQRRRRQLLNYERDDGQEAHKGTVDVSDNVTDDGIGNCEFKDDNIAEAVQGLGLSNCCVNWSAQRI
jgi:hypothetical protein